MWRQVRSLLEMIRFSHSVFVLPFALLAAVMAWTAPWPSEIDAGFRWRHLLGLVVCIVTARSAAMAFNRIADREIDRLNPRTKLRHLPSRAISLRAAIAFTIVAGLVFVAGTALFWPNRLPLLLSLPVLAYLLGYSYAKRFTWLSHFWLGGALMLAPVATWIAIRGEIVLIDPKDLLPALILGLAVMFWVAGFDIIYACQDFEFDRATGLKSIPARFGLSRALRLAAAGHLAMLGCLVILPLAAQSYGPRLDFGWLYWGALAAIGGLLAYEHAIVRPDDLSRVNRAFFNVNAVISVGLFAAASIDLIFV